MGSPSVPSAPQYQNFNQADTQAGASLAGLGSYAAQGQPFAQNIAANPNAAGYQSAAGSAAGQYGTLGGNATSASGALYGAGTSALPYAQQILQTGFDPQNALYNRTQQQVQDQTLSGLAMTGTASTPYGASVLGQTDSNFNIDWQNQQLSREQTAASGYGTLLSGIESAFTQGGQQGQAGANATLASGQLPWATTGAINTAALGGLGAGQSLDTSAMSAADQYLGLNNQNYANQVQAYQAQSQASAALFGGLGNLFGSAVGSGGLASLFPAA